MALNDLQTNLVGFGWCFGPMHLNAVFGAVPFQLLQQLRQFAQRALTDGVAARSQLLEGVKVGKQIPAPLPQGIHGGAQVAAQLAVVQGLFEILGKIDHGLGHRVLQQEFGDVFGGNRTVAMLQRPTDVHQATAVAGKERGSAGLLDIRDLVGHHRRGDIGLFDREEPPNPQHSRSRCSSIISTFSTDEAVTWRMRSPASRAARYRRNAR